MRRYLIFFPIVCNVILILGVNPGHAQFMSHLWSQHFGDNGPCVGQGVATDGADNIIITGYYWGPVDFGGGPLASGDLSLYLAKFDPSGNHLWSQGFGGSIPLEAGGSFDDGGGHSVATDGEDNIIITGYFSDTVDFGGGPLSSAGGSDIYMAKFAPNGNHLWSRRFGSIHKDRGRSIATDGVGNIVITGYFSDTVDFGGEPLTSAGWSDIFIAKFAPNGNHLWSQRVGSIEDDRGLSVALDRSDNIFTTGSFYGTVDFGGEPLTSVGWRDIYVAKFEANGNHRWSRRFGDNISEGTGVVTDGYGHVIATGYFSDTVDFGGEPLTSAGGHDIYLAELDHNGNRLWSRRFGDNSFDTATSVIRDGSHNVVITGYFEDTVDFGGGLLTSAGEGDIYIAKFDANGNHLLSQRFGDNFGDLGASVATDGMDNVIATGTFEGTVDFGGGPMSSAQVWDDIYEDDIYVVKFDAEAAEPVEIICPNDSTILGFTTLPYFVLTSFRITNSSSDTLAFDYELIDEGPAALVDNGEPTSIFGTTPPLAPDSSFSPPEAALAVPAIREYTQEVVTYHVSVADHPCCVDSCKTVIVFESPLAVFIKDFSGKPVDMGVELSWQVMSDEEIRGFKIYRRTGGVEVNEPIYSSGLIPSDQRRYIDNDVQGETTYEYILAVVLQDGSEVQSHAVKVNTKALELALYQNYPNPFNPTTTISFTLPAKCTVRLAIYNIEGKLVKTLVDGPLDEGFREIAWNGEDDRGNTVSTGIYFYQLKAGKRILTKKMMLMK